MICHSIKFKIIIMLSAYIIVVVEVVRDPQPHDYVTLDRHGV